MKKNKVWLLLGIVLFIASCGNDVSPIVGTWHFDRNGNTIEFTEDGYMITNGAFERREKYSFDGKYLIYYSNGKNVTVKCEIKDVNGSLQMDIEQDGQNSTGRKAGR